MLKPSSPTCHLVIIEVAVAVGREVVVGATVVVERVENVKGCFNFFPETAT